MEILTNEVIEVLILDLLEWVADGTRSYADVMDAWRTSCPRLPVWEDATDRGLLQTEIAGERILRVRLTASGRALLAEKRSIPPESSGWMGPGPESRGPGPPLGESPNAPG